MKKAYYVWAVIVVGILGIIDVVETFGVIADTMSEDPDVAWQVGCAIGAAIVVGLLWPCFHMYIHFIKFSIRQVKGEGEQDG